VTTPFPPGTRVCIAFSLRLEDGTEVDGTAEGETWCPCLGDGNLIPALEQAVSSLKPGERQTFVFGPLDAYGLRDESLIHPLPVADFPSTIALEPGTVIAFSAPTGDEIPGRIIESDGASVRVDFNHPLAGHTVTFDVHLVSVESAEGVAR